MNPIYRAYRTVYAWLSRRLAPAPADDWWYSTVQARTAAGVDVTEATALNYSAVWAATRLLSFTGGHLPFNLYRNLPSGGKEVARNHSVHNLLHDLPNPEMSAMMFRARGLQQQINWGNAYAEVQRDPLGRPMALWPIHASRVSHARTKQGDLRYVIRQNDLTETTLLPEEMFHVPSPMSDDGVLGKGVVTQARESIGLGQALEKQAAAFFGNGQRPDIVVTHPNRLSPEARSNFRKEWAELHRGPEKAHEIALLSEGAKVEVLGGMSNEDSQFLETRSFQVREIARWYGVPSWMIEDDKQTASYASAEVSGIWFVVYSLIPWLKLWEQEVWRKLLTPDERRTYYAKHVVDALLRGDAASRTQALQTQFFNGALTLDEWREIEDRNPLPEDQGKVHFVQSSMIPLAQLLNPPEPEPEPMPDDEDEDDLPPTQQEDEGMAPSVRPFVLALAGRIARRQSAETRRAAGKPERYLDWMDRWLPQEQEAMLRDLEPAGEMSGPVAAYIGGLRVELFRLADSATPAELAAVANAWANSWEQYRPEQLTREIMEAIAHVQTSAVRA